MDRKFLFEVVLKYNSTFTFTDCNVQASLHAFNISKMNKSKNTTAKEVLHAT